MIPIITKGKLNLSQGWKWCILTSQGIMFFVRIPCDVCVWFVFCKQGCSFIQVWEKGQVCIYIYYTESLYNISMKWNKNNHCCPLLRWTHATKTKPPVNRNIPETQPIYMNMFFPDTSPYSKINRTHLPFSNLHLFTSNLHIMHPK